MSVECKHDQTELEDTKKGVYRVCKICGVRIEKVAKEIIIEKVDVPEAMEKRDGSPD